MTDMQSKVLHYRKKGGRKVLLNKNFVGVQTCGNLKQILLDTNKHVSVGCVVPQELGVRVGKRLIVKAGTPIHYDLFNPFAPVEEPTEEEGNANANANANPNGEFDIFYWDDVNIYGDRLRCVDKYAFWNFFKNISAIVNDPLYTGGGDVSVEVNDTENPTGLTIQYSYTDYTTGDNVWIPAGVVYAIDGIDGVTFDTSKPKQQGAYEACYFSIAPKVDKFVVTGNAPFDIVDETKDNLYAWSVNFNPYQYMSFPFKTLVDGYPELYEQYFMNTNNYHITFKPSVEEPSAPNTMIEISTDFGVVPDYNDGSYDPSTILLDNEPIFLPFDPVDNPFALFKFKDGKGYADLYNNGQGCWLNIQRKVGGGGGGGSNMNAVLLHDVDVTYGANNGTALLHGIVNLARVDAETAEKLTPYVDNESCHLKFVTA